ncbi:hypothetical protein [Jeotgalicoccus halotolerans]|nr:hypothetical protein [Jeotgalicoccus halotolerans]
MNIIFKLLMFVGAGLLIYNAEARPGNTFLFSTVGVLLIMSAGFMVLKSNRSKITRTFYSKKNQTGKGLFSPIFTVIQTIFVTLLIGGLLFYLTRSIFTFLINTNPPSGQLSLLFSL